MASSTNGTGNNVDEIRYRSYLSQMEREQDSKIKEKEDTHRERLANLITNHDEQTKLLHKDYDVKISEEAEILDHKLSQIRERNQNLMTEERESGEHESEKVHNQYAQKIDQEKKNGDEQIVRLQAYYKKASEDLRHQFDKERAKNSVQRGKSS